MIKATKENNLAVVRPDLAKEWNQAKNGDLTPYDVTCKSNKMVSWIQPYDDPRTGKHFDFVWDAIIANRTKGAGCPVFSGKMVWPGFNDLATTHPDLAKEWNFAKNGDLTPYDVAFKSNKKVSWVQPYDDPQTGKHFDFEWEAPIWSRVRGDGCPVLSGKMAWPGFNDLATTHPDLAKEWNFAKNGDLTPRNVTAGSNKEVSWIKEYDGELKEWRARIYNRAVLGNEYYCVSSSKLESNISKILKSNDIVSQNESCFDDLISKNGRHYRYDFQLVDNKVLVECDGAQHFQNVKHYYKNDEAFLYRIESDNIKNAYALENGMALLRIPYIYFMPKKKKELEEIVLEFIETKRVPQKILDFYSQFEFSNYVECVNKFQNQLEKTAA